MSNTHTLPTRLVKKAVQDALMEGMKTAIAHLPEDALGERRIAEEQFRRVEKLFGYEPYSWPIGNSVDNYIKVFREDADGTG